MNQEIGAAIAGALGAGRDAAMNTPNPTKNSGDGS